MPHIGRIPATLEKYRRALSAYLEEIDQVDSLDPDHKMAPLHSPIVDPKTRINRAHSKVHHELSLLSSNFSWISDDLHGDLQLLRSNEKLLHCSTSYLASQRTNATKHSYTVKDGDSDSHNSLNLDSQQTKAMQYIITILLKFIQSNISMVDYILRHQSNLDSYWILNTASKSSMHTLHPGLYWVCFLRIAWCPSKFDMNSYLFRYRINDTV